MVRSSCHRRTGVAGLALNIGAAAFACGGDGSVNHQSEPADAMPAATGEAGRTDAGADRPSLRFVTTCDLGEGDTELTWEPVPGAVDYQVTWPGGAASVAEPTVRLTGPLRTYLVRAQMRDGTPGPEAEWRSSHDIIAGDTLLLRGRREGKDTWEPISCIERRLAGGGEETLAPNASPSFGPGSAPSSLVGSAFLFPRSEREPVGDLLAATSDGVLRFGYGGPWAPALVTIQLAPASPAALYVDAAASYVARADGALVRQPHFYYAADAAAPDVLTSAELGGRRVFGIVPDGDGAWVLAANDGTPAGQPSRALHFEHLVAAATATQSVAIPDDSKSPDYRFDPTGFALVNRNGTGSVHVATISPGALVWQTAPGAPTNVRALRSSSLHTFVVDGDSGSRVTGYSRLDFREPLFVLKVPDATDLEVVGFTARYHRPLLP